MNRTTLTIIGFSLFSFGAGYFVSNNDNISNSTFSLTPLSSKKISSTVYTCPMHSHISKNESGSCPICNMALVAKNIDNNINANNINQITPIRISSGVINNFAIKTDTVKKGTLYRELLTYGYVKKIESVTEKDIISAVTGKIIYVLDKKNDDETEKNELLITIESTEWLALQQAYLTALDKKDVRNLRQVTQQLNAAGFNLKDIQQLKHSQKPTAEFKIYSSQQGILKNFNIKLGQVVEANKVIFAIAPVYPIIGYAEVFEGQWRWLETGHKATMIIRSVSGVTWQGVVLEVDDILMNRSRTIKTKLGFKVQEGILLKAGMQANFTIFAAPKHKVLYVPQDAVIRTQNESKIITALGNGQFQPVKVQTGLDDGSKIEIVTGVTEGMKIVTSGQFLLDSESQLNAELQRMQLN